MLRWLSRRVRKTWTKFTHWLMPELASSAKVLQRLLEEVLFMTVALEKLQAEVAQTATVIDSAVNLISGLAQQIRELKDDPIKLDALADQLDAKSNALAAAVAANTPPVDTPPVDVPPVDTPPVDTPPADVPPADVPPAEEAV